MTNHMESKTVAVTLINTMGNTQNDPSLQIRKPQGLMHS